MANITSKILKDFIRRASQQLKGEWVILGGTVLPLLNIDTRVTVDIDFVAKDLRTNEQDLALMKLIQQMGLPLEALNQSGHFYLHEIPDWQNHLIEVARQGKTVIYRPNAELFIRLKLERFTPTDLADCLQMLKYAKKHKEPMDVDALKNTITHKLKSAGDNRNLIERLGVLHQSL